MANTKRAIWCSLLSIQNEAISLVTMRSKELWLVQENHATVKLDVNCFSWKENVQQKQNWTAESTNLKEIVEKITAVFVIKILVVTVEFFFAVTVLFLVNMNSICYFLVQTFKGPVSSQALSSLLQNQVHGPTTAPITVSVSACMWCMIVILACYTIHDEIS